MPNVPQEREHLVQADRHIAEGAKRVASQACLIRRMTGKGQDTLEAKKLLRLFRHTLKLWRAHRELILDAIARG